MKRLTTPISEAAIRELKVGDEILLNGRVVLSRDIDTVNQCRSC